MRQALQVKFTMNAEGKYSFFCWLFRREVLTLRGCDEDTCLARSMKVIPIGKDFSR